MKKKICSKKILTVMVFALLCLPAFSGSLLSNSFISNLNTAGSEIAIAVDTEPEIQPLNNKESESVILK